MASSLTVTGTQSFLEEARAKGTHRSRLSIHLNTARRRRWLMVQLITMPNSSVDDSEDSLQAHNRQVEPTTGWQHLVDDFQRTSIATRCL